MAEVEGIAPVAVTKLDPYSMQNSACIGTFGPSSTDFLPLSSASRPLSSAESYAPSSAVVVPPCSTARLPPSAESSPPSLPPSPHVASFLLPPGPIIFHPNVTMQS